MLLIPQEFNEYMKNHWLIKSEASCYSIDDFSRDKKTGWSGIRNYQARNFMRDGMKIGDLVLFYHSSSEPTAVVGVARVASAPYPDHTAWDKKDDHYDPKSPKEKPVWMMVDVEFVERFKEPVPLSLIKLDPAFSGMVLIQRGSRLSVQPVSESHFKRIVELGKRRV